MNDVELTQKIIDGLKDYFEKIIKIIQDNIAIIGKIQNDQISKIHEIDLKIKDADHKIEIIKIDLDETHNKIKSLELLEKEFPLVKESVEKISKNQIVFNDKQDEILLFVKKKSKSLKYIIVGIVSSGAMTALIQGILELLKNKTVIP